AACPACLSISHPAHPPHPHPFPTRRSSDLPIGAVRVGMNDGELVLNPSREQIDAGDLELIVAGTEDAIMMVEAGANQIPEEKMRSEEHTSELQSRGHLVCRLLLEKKNMDPE